MWAGPAKKWVDALTKLLAQTEDKEEGWLYVPGHGVLTPDVSSMIIRRFFPSKLMSDFLQAT